MGPVGDPRIVYRPREDANPQAELDALSAVYLLCLSKTCNVKEDAHPGVPNDAQGSSSDGAKPILHE